MILKKLYRFRNFVYFSEKKGLITRSGQNYGKLDIFDLTSAGMVVHWTLIVR